MNTYSLRKNIFHGVPRGSILDPLLFNIHLCDLFYSLETWTSQAMRMILQFIPLQGLSQKMMIVTIFRTIRTNRAIVA